MVELNNSSSNVSPAPVYTSTQLNDMERTLDNDDPLYFSTETDNGDYTVPPESTQWPPAKPARTDEADYEYLSGFPLLPSQPPPPPHTRHTPLHDEEDYDLPPDAFATSIKIYEAGYDLPPDEQGLPLPPVHDEEDYDLPPDAFATSITIDEADYDLPPDEQGIPFPPSKPSKLPHSVSTGNLGNQLNPYGEYSDGTIRRVASQISVGRDMFDNADYADPLELSS